MTSEALTAAAAAPRPVAKDDRRGRTAAAHLLDLLRRAASWQPRVHVHRPGSVRAAAAAAHRVFRRRAQQPAAAPEEARAELTAVVVYARTLPPAAAAQTLSAPRVSAGRITVTERIRQAYELADAPAAMMLARLGWAC